MSSVYQNALFPRLANINNMKTRHSGHPLEASAEHTGHLKHAAWGPGGGLSRDAATPALVINLEKDVNRSRLCWYSTGNPVGEYHARPASDQRTSAVRPVVAGEVPGGGGWVDAEGTFGANVARGPVCRFRGRRGFSHAFPGDCGRGTGWRHY